MQDLFMLKMRWIFVLLVQLLGLVLHGQPFNLSHLDVEDGLPAPSIRAIHEDHKGFLWLGTFGGGLVRFDGKIFRPIPRESTRFSTTVNAIFEDKEGQLWVGTEKGPCVFDRDRFIENSLNAVLNPINTKVYGFSESSDGQLYVASHQGLWILKGKTLFADTSRGLPKIPVRAVAQTHWGTVVGTQSGLYLLNKAKWEPIPDAAFQVNALLYDKASKTLWVAHAQGLDSWNSTKVAHVALANDFMGNYATSLHKMKDGSLWIGTLNFPVRWFNGKAERFGEPPFPMQQSIIQRIFQDSHGQIWLGTYGGLYRLNTPAFYRLQPEPMQDIPANHFLPMADSSVWICSDAGAFRWKNNRIVEQITQAQGLPEPGVTMMAYDGTAYWIIVPNHPPLRFLNGKISSPFAASYPFATTHFVRRLPDGRIAFTGNGGVMVWDGSEPRFLFSGKDLPMSLIYDVCQDSKGDLWFSGTEGIVRWAQGKPVLHIAEAQGLPEKLVYSIRCDSKDRIWAVCYGGGLVAIQNEKVNLIEPPNPSFGQEWMALEIQPNAEELWMGGVRGMVHLKKSSAGYDWKAYGPAQGVFGQSVLIDGICRAANGDLFAGTTKGLVWMPLVRQDQANILPKVYLNSYRTDGYLVEGQSPDSLNGLSVAAGTRSIQLSFACLDLSGDLGQQFEYHVSGIHGNFIPSPSGLISLLGLDPGAYRFEIRARNSVGQVGPSLVFTLTIPPLWYERVWVQWLFGLLVLFGMGGLVFFWFRKRETDLKEKARLFERLSSLQLRTLKQNLNPHFLGNSLSNLQGLLLSNETEKAYKYVEDFGQVLKKSLGSDETEFIPLHEELEFLRFYFSLENERLNEEIRLEVEWPTNLDLDAWRVPHLISQPLVENAFKHGFNQSKGGSLLVSVQATNQGNLRIRVVSHAPGSGSSRATGSGMGLSLLKQRLDALFGEREVAWIRWGFIDPAQFEVEITLPPNLD